VPQLIAQLDTPDKAAQLKAIQDLGAFGPDARAAVTHLLKLLRKDDLVLRQQVLEALAKIGPPEKEDVNTLVLLLRDKGFDGGRRYAGDALGALGPDARESAVALSEVLAENDTDLKRKALTSLGKLGPEVPQAVQMAMLEALRDRDGESVKLAREALSKLG